MDASTADLAGRASHTAGGRAFMVDVQLFTLNALVQNVIRSVTHRAAVWIAAVALVVAVVAVSALTALSYSAAFTPTASVVVTSARVAF